MNWYVKAKKLRTRALFGWAFAGLSCLVALAARFALWDALPPGFPFLTFFPAIILTLFLGGLWPGIACGLASGLAAWFFFIPPYSSWELDALSGVALGFFFVVIGVDAAIIHALHHALDLLREEKLRSAAQEASLRASEARFRAVQDTSIDGFMVLESVRDPSGGIVDFQWVYANAAAERIIGKSSGWFVGRRLLEEMPGNRDDGLFDAYRRVVETGEAWSQEFTYQHEGLDVFIRAVAARVGDGFAVSFADLSERRRTEILLRESETKLDGIVNSIDQMIWSTQPDGFHDYFNARWYEFTGVAPGTTDGDQWSGLFHPDDQKRAWARWRHSLDTGEPYRIEYRLRHHSGQYRWVIGRAQPFRDASGQITRWFGTCTDIHDLKTAEEERELIARELSHRIKNIFSVVTSLVSLSARGDPTARPFAQAVRSRIDALAKAHEYIRPHSPDSYPGHELQTLHGLFKSLLAAYRDNQTERVIVTGCDAPVGVRAATAFALIIHELATNAVKYGALSAVGGTVSLSCSCDQDTYVVVWRERGGPALRGAPTRHGFGTIMSEKAAEAQLGARTHHEWAPEGLIVTLRIPVLQLSY